MFYHWDQRARADGGVRSETEETVREAVHTDGEIGLCRGGPFIAKVDTVTSDNGERIAVR